MEEIEVIHVEETELNSPVLIEGLPGVGHVGKLVAEHLVDELPSTLLRQIHSQHFPPQCTVNEDGLTELVSTDIYHCELGKRDAVVLTGDHQSQTIDGHYKITETLLEFADEFGVSEVYTLGGIATGELVEEYSVVGASNDQDLLERVKEYGVESGGGEPAGGIIGVSGLLLGLGEPRDLPGVCLMGETSGYIVDPKSANAVLDVLMEALDFEVSTQKLEERAEEMEEVVKRLEEMNQVQQMPQFAGDEDLRYIG